MTYEPSLLRDFICLLIIFIVGGAGGYILGKSRGYNRGVMDGCAFGANEERTFRNGIVARARIDATRKAIICERRKAEDARLGVALRPRLGRSTRI